jgi:hypothetical protein
VLAAALSLSQVGTTKAGIARLFAERNIFFLSIIEFQQAMP